MQVMVLSQRTSRGDARSCAFDGKRRGTVTALPNRQPLSPLLCTTHGASHDLPHHELVRAVQSVLVNQMCVNGWVLFFPGVPSSTTTTTTTATQFPRTLSRSASQDAPLSRTTPTSASGRGKAVLTPLVAPPTVVVDVIAEAVSAAVAATTTSATPTEPPKMAWDGSPVIGRRMLSPNAESTFDASFNEGGCG